MLSVELSTPKEYINWLQIVTSWEETGNVSNDFAQYVIHQTQQALISQLLFSF